MLYVLLPYEEEDAVFKRFDRTMPDSYYRDSTSNPGLTSSVIETFICPSDTSNSPADTYLQNSFIVPAPPPPFQDHFTGRYACTNYAANGLVFRTNLASIPKSIPDGLSQTLLFVERFRLCGGTENLWGYGGNWSTNGCGG